MSAVVHVSVYRVVLCAFRQDPVGEKRFDSLGRAIFVNMELVG